MYRGRFQQGQEAPLMVLTHDGSDTPMLPDNAPTLDVWTPTAKVKTVLMPVLDRYGATGLFRYPLYLDSTFTAGLYRAIYRWTVGTYQGLEEDDFEVLPGGNGDGAVIGLYHYEKPHARFLVQQLSGGALVRGRNPSV